MRFLVDNAVSPIVSSGLAAAGYDSVHVLDYGMEAEADTVILARAKEEQRALISLDTDFGTLLALRKASLPSLILMRHVPKTPGAQLRLLLSELPHLRDAIERGSIVTLEPWRIRIRKLPVDTE